MHAEGIFDMMVQILNGNADELKTRIAELPSGYISRETINGKVRLYYQRSEDGKKRSKYPCNPSGRDTTACSIT